MAQIDSVQLTKHDVASLMNGLGSLWGSSDIQRVYDAMALLLHADEHLRDDEEHFYSLARRIRFVNDDAS